MLRLCSACLLRRTDANHTRIIYAHKRKTKTRRQLTLGRRRATAAANMVLCPGPTHTQHITYIRTSALRRAQQQVMLPRRRHRRHMSRDETETSFSRRTVHTGVPLIGAYNTRVHTTQTNGDGGGSVVMVIAESSDAGKRIRNVKICFRGNANIYFNYGIYDTVCNE